MASLDTRLHELEARVDSCEAAIEASPSSDYLAQVEARVAALEACVDCDQVPPCPRPKQAARPAPQQPRSCATCQRYGDGTIVCPVWDECTGLKMWQPRGGGG